MPLKHICPAAGCTVLLELGATHCPRHQQDQAKRQASYDHSIRQTHDAKYTAFYHSPEWERMAEYVRIKYNGLCLWSYYRGKIEPMAAIHHIEPVKAAWDLRLDAGNLIPLSHTAHMIVEAAYRQGGQEVKRELRGMLRRWREEFGA